MATGCARRPAKRADAVEPRRQPVDVTVKNTDTVQEDELGNRLWRLKADSLNVNELDATARADGAKVVVFGPGDSVRLNLICPRVVTDIKERRLVASGGIKVEGPSTQTKFQSDDVVVDLNSNQITAKGNVRGSRPFGIFTANKLESDLKFTHIRMSSPEGVKMVFRPEFIKNDR